MLWARTEKGKRTPLDPLPYIGDDPRGRFVLREREQQTPLAVAVPAGAFTDEPHYISHFATCPNSAEHRKKR